MYRHEAIALAQRVRQEVTQAPLTDDVEPWIATAIERAARHASATRIPQPLPVVLHCPECRAQHIDAPSPGWDNPPHRSHQCAECGCVWRAADVETTGVAHVSTRGKADTWPSELQPKIPVAWWRLVYKGSDANGSEVFEREYTTGAQYPEDSSKGPWSPLFAQ